MSAVQDLARDTLAVVLAGGQGTRLGALTRRTCKPALPFGAAYRNIDFSLANCVNSGIGRIGIATQHNPDVLVRHVERVWEGRSDRDDELIAVWPAQTCAPSTGYRGTADAVFRNLVAIEKARPGFVLVLAGDHVYQMDYRPMLDFHQQRAADVTLACVEVSADAASQFGILEADGDGRIRRFVEKPKSRADLPAADRIMASMGIYVFGTSFLSRVLRRDALASESRHDFGRDIVPSLLRRARVLAYPFENAEGPAYWRDVGTPGAYWRAQLDLLEARPGIRLDDPDWPLPPAWGVTAERRSVGRPAKALKGERCCIAAGDCEVVGVVNRSVLFPGVQIGAGSIVDSSVMLPGAVIGRNCRISGAIVDGDCRIPDGTVLESAPPRGHREAVEPCSPLVVTAEDFVPEPVLAYA